MSYPVKCPVCEGRGHVHGGFYYPTPGMPSVSNAIQEEREACARIAGMYLYDSNSDYHICKGIAQAIRQRKNENRT